MANVNIRVDDNIKKQAESIFAELGMSMSTATNIFYRQVVRTGGVPFELKIQPRHPKHLDLSQMTKEELYAELQQAWDSARAGRVTPAKLVWEEMERFMEHELDS
jgi:DNA-damage-inducible protein J